MVTEGNGFHGFFEVSATMLVGFKRSIWLRNYMGKMPMPRRKPHGQDGHATLRLRKRRKRSPGRLMVRSAGARGMKNE
jgi:hypothetical protein